MEEQKQITTRQVINLDFAKLASLIVKDLTKANESLKVFRRYKKEDVIKYLENPPKNETRLREISLFLYNNSSHYKRLINHFAKMPLFYYTVQPYGLDITKVNQKTFKLQYQKILNILNNMNMSHEFQKILTIAFRDDVFYGYVYESDDSFFIQRLDSDYCQISSIEDGCYNLAFDMSYFDKYPKKLDAFAPEFKSKHTNYTKDKNLKWQELDSTKTICIKINEELDFVYPPFANVFGEIFDIEDYKMLKKAKEEIGNYQLLVEQIPLRNDSDSNNDFSIELDIAKAFHEKAVESLPDQVGMILSPMEINAINFKRDTADADRVIEAENNFWSSAGVSVNLYGGNANSGAVLNMGIKTDEEMAFSTLRQLERWVNRKLKQIGGTFKFKINFLNLTLFNQSEMIDEYLKLAQYGVPVKSVLCASVGMSPLDMVTMNWLENDILQIVDTWKPLASSHTQSGSESTGGRPTSKVKEKSGEQTENNDGNNPDNRT